MNNSPAITPEEVEDLLCSLDGDVASECHNAESSLENRSVIIAREYLKLHEENQQLRGTFVTLREKIMMPVPIYYPLEPGQSIGRVDWGNISLIDILKEIDEAISLTKKAQWVCK